MSSPLDSINRWRLFCVGDRPRLKTVLEKMNRAVPVLMGVFIFLAPFVQDTSIKEICFYSSLGITLILAFTGSIRFSLDTPMTRGFAAFALWAAIGVATALNVPNTINDILAHLIKYLAISFMLAHYFGSPRGLETLSWVVIGSCAAFCLFYMGFFYLYLGNPFPERLVLYPYRDYLYVFGFFLSIHKLQSHDGFWGRLLAVVAILALLAATLLGKGRSPLLAIFVGLCIFSLFGAPVFKRFTVAVIVLIVIGVALTPGFRDRFDIDQVLLNDRVQTNHITLEIIKDYPVTGIGFGMQTYGYKEFIDLDAYRMRIPEKARFPIIIASPHNFLMDIAVRTGIVGVAIFLYTMARVIGMLVSLIRHAKDSVARGWAVCLGASFAGFFTQSLFGDAAYDLQAIVFYTILAMIIILWRQAQPEA